MTLPLSPKRLAPVTRPRPAPATPGLATALLEQQVVSVRRPRVQDAVLPVRARRHQLLAAGHPGDLEHLLRLVQVAHSELPGQYPVRAGRRESLVPLDAELDRPVPEREEIRVLGTLVGHAEPEPEVEIPFRPQIADEQNRDDPPKQRCHRATQYR